MSHAEHAAGALRPLSQCAPEIQAVVRDEFQNDPSRLKVGDRLTAYVASGNTDETWEVARPGTTLTQVMVRLVDIVPERSGA